MRSVFTLVAFLMVFFGLLSVVGNVHVAEFYGILFIASIVTIYVWFKVPGWLEQIDGINGPKRSN
jgi:hypothetical protein